MCKTCSDTNGVTMAQDLPVYHSAYLQVHKGLQRPSHCDRASISQPALQQAELRQLGEAAHAARQCRASIDECQIFILK
jgi:hypothetical protein